MLPIEARTERADEREMYGIPKQRMERWDRHFCQGQHDRHGSVVLLAALASIRLSTIVVTVYSIFYSTIVYQLSIVAVLVRAHISNNVLRPEHDAVIVSHPVVCDTPTVH